MNSITENESPEKHFIFYFNIYQADQIISRTFLDSFVIAILMIQFKFQDSQTSRKYRGLERGVLSFGRQKSNISILMHHQFIVVAFKIQTKCVITEITLFSPA